jgi:hypothetical protein
LFFLLVTAFTEAGSQADFILSYHGDTGELVPFQALLGPFPVHLLQLSPDFQFLTTFAFPYANVENLAEGQIRFLALDPSEPFFPFSQSYETESTDYDWSGDGRWLLLSETNALRLIAPGAQYDQLIPYNLGGCYDAAWVKAEVAE